MFSRVSCFKCPDNEEPKFRDDKVQEAVDAIFKNWTDKEKEHSICETHGLSKGEEDLVFKILLSHGWAVYTKPDYHLNETVYVNVRMPTYGTQV